MGMMKETSTSASTRQRMQGPNNAHHTEELTRWAGGWVRDRQDIHTMHAPPPPPQNKTQHTLVFFAMGGAAMGCASSSMEAVEAECPRHGCLSGGSPSILAVGVVWTGCGCGMCGCCFLSSGRCEDSEEVG